MSAAVGAEAGQAGDGWRYTARPEWSSTGESMWMRLAKFSLCNRLSVTALAALFALEGDSATSIDLRRADRWDVEALAAVLEVCADDVRAGFCVGQPPLALGNAWHQLRFCRACLANGFHAAWFQWRLVEHCPLHRLPLQTGCLRCAAPVPYTLGRDPASSPLSCARCGCAWVPGLSRPAGRCAPLASRDSRLLGRWAAYIGDALGDEDGQRLGERHDGRSGVAASLGPALRAHPLTMVNRLFDTPPPLAAELLRRPACRNPALPPRAPGPGTRDDRSHPDYEAAAWPHFDRRFAQCEHVLRKAQEQLFGDVHDEHERSGWRDWLASDLVAPAQAMDPRTAAALGWAVTWMSAVRALAPEAGLPTPALGLAGWLASLPVRPQGTPSRRWQTQVLAWLEDDLVLAARMWGRIAAFMRAKGAYLLHGALVDLPQLARQHRTTS